MKNKTKQKTTGSAKFCSFSKIRRLLSEGTQSKKLVYWSIVLGASPGEALKHHRKHYEMERIVIY